MTRPELLQKIQEVFDSVFLDEVTVTPDLSAADVDEWDSVTNVTLVVAIERQLGIRFGLGEIEGARNVGELLDVIERHLA